MNFDTIYRTVQPHTIVPRERALVLYNFTRYAAINLTGDMAELGCFRGGMSLLMRAACPFKTMYAFDTFTGIPRVDPIDGHKVGEFASDDKTVERLTEANIYPIRGMFPESILPGMDKNRYAIGHFDGDTYSSCRDFIHFFWPRMVTGGVMVFDDYGWINCAGTTKAVDDFAAENNAEVLEFTRYQCVIIK